MALYALAEAASAGTATSIAQTSNNRFFFIKEWRNKIMEWVQREVLRFLI